MRTKITMLISIMSLFLISSCHKNSSNEIEYSAMGTDPIIFIHNLVDAGMDMAVKGTLKYGNNSKCLFLDDSVEHMMITPI